MWPKLMFNTLYSNMKFLVLFETSTPCMCIVTWYAAIVLQCSSSIGEDGSSAFVSIKCHSDELINSDKYLTCFDEPTANDIFIDEAKGLKCALEM